MPRNPDPKHGRWILPLIIVAMVVLTITFVTSLEPAEQEEGTTTTLPPPSTTTTTTLPSDVAAFLVTLDVYESQVTAFQADVNAINSDWEEQRNYDQAHSSFEEASAAVASWEDEVAGAEVPSALAEGHVQLVLEVEQLAPAVDDIISGLEAPDDGTLRRQAVIAFNDQVDAILTAIDDLRDQAATTGTSVPGDGETTTSTFGEEPTTSLTTSTTSAAQASAFQALLDSWVTQARALRDDITAVNSDWEAAEITFDGALASFTAVRTSAEDWVDEITASQEVPASLAQEHQDLVVEAGQLPLAIDNIIAGLQAADDGTQRRQAVTAFGDQIEVVLSVISTLRG